MTTFPDAWMRAHGQPTHAQVAHLSTLPESPDPRKDPPWKPDCNCGADDPELEQLRDLIAGGMGQFEASRIVWPLDVVVEVKEAITPRLRRMLRGERKGAA
jgi:hypothetical protein